MPETALELVLKSFQTYLLWFRIASTAAASDFWPKSHDNFIRLGSPLARHLVPRLISTWLAMHYHLLAANVYQCQFWQYQHYSSPIQFIQILPKDFTHSGSSNQSELGNQLEKNHSCCGKLTQLYCTLYLVHMGH